MSKRQLNRRDFLRLSAAAATGAIVAACAPATPKVVEVEKEVPVEKIVKETVVVEKVVERPAKPARKLELTYWTGWSGFEFDALQELIDKFNEESEEAHFTMTTVFGQYEKVLTAIAAGTPPDVVSAVWLSQLVSMAARDGFLPVEDYAAQSGLKAEEFFPNEWDAWHWNGHLWGIAITSSSSMIAYRKDLFREVGLDPENPPQTIVELDEAADKLTKYDDEGNLERIGYFPGGLAWWGRVFGGTLYDEESQKITADDPAIVEALTWMQSYAKKYDITKIDAFQQGFGDYMSVNNPFFVGKQGMTQIGEWFISFIAKFAPQLDKDIDFMPAPYPEGGRENCTTFGGSVFCIPNGVPYPDVSWELIEFLQRDENMGQFCFAIHNVPPKMAVAYEDRFISDPRFKLSVDLLSGKNSFGPPKTPVTSFYFAKLGEAEDAVKHGEKEPKAALEEVVQLTQEELDKALKRAG